MRWTTKVVGVTYAPGYPDNLHRLRDAIDSGLDAHGEGVAAVLIREPDNAYDANAIRVDVPAIGGPIGHVPRELAATIAPILDAGTRMRSAITEVLIHPRHPDRPGIGLVMEEVQEGPATRSALAGCTCASYYMPEDGVLDEFCPVHGEPR